MKNNRFLTFLVPLLFLPFTAMADGGLFLEPGVSYQVSTSKMGYPDPMTNSNADSNGFGAVARLGFHINETFFVGADGRYVFIDLNDSDNNFNADAKAYNIAPFVGFQMPDMGLRIWGAWILLGEMNPAESDGFDSKFSEAQGFRIGGGFRYAAVSINLEYERIDYRNSDLRSAPAIITGSSSELSLDSEAYIVSLTFPLEL